MKSAGILVCYLGPLEQSRYSIYDFQLFRQVAAVASVREIDEYFLYAAFERKNRCVNGFAGSTKAESGRN